MLVKYARLKRDGRTLVTCNPSQVELDDPSKRREHQGSDGKVIFDTYEKAEACLRELSQFPNARPMRIYQCGRSRRGHVHIATDRKRLYGEPAAKIGTGGRRQERNERRRSAKKGESAA